MLDPVSWQCSDGKIVRNYSHELDKQSGKLRLIEQTLLPEQLEYVVLDDTEAIFDAIKRLVVRGAPAIGCAAAIGLTARRGLTERSMRGAGGSWCALFLG